MHCLPSLPLIPAEFASAISASCAPPPPSRGQALLPDGEKNRAAAVAKSPSISYSARPLRSAAPFRAWTVCHGACVWPRFWDVQFYAGADRGRWGADAVAARRGTADDPERAVFQFRRRPALFRALGGGRICVGGRWAADALAQERARHRAFWRYDPGQGTALGLWRDYRQLCRGIEAPGRERAGRGIDSRGHGPTGAFRR